jgi:hypothetical protein
MTPTARSVHSYPPGVSPPVGEISATNQSGLILVMTSMAMCFVLISLAIRLYVRVPNRTWKTEDNIFAGAAVRQKRTVGSDLSLRFTVLVMYPVRHCLP